MVGVGWVTVKEQEKEIWKKLLKEFGVKAKEVVQHQELHAPRMKKLKPSFSKFERDIVAISRVSPVFFTPDSNTWGDNTSGYTSDNTSDHTWCTTHSTEGIGESTDGIGDSALGGSTMGASTMGSSTMGASTMGGGGKRPRIKTGKKKIWLNTAFKEAYQFQKSKLHQRDYGVVSGVFSDPGDY